MAKFIFLGLAGLALPNLTTAMTSEERLAAIQRIKRKNPRYTGARPSEAEPEKEIPMPESEADSKIDWHHMALEANDPYYQNPENFLVSRPESGQYCPPTAWIDRFWDYSIQGHKPYVAGFTGLGKIQEFDMAFKHCKKACANRDPEPWEQEKLKLSHGHGDFFQLTPDFVAEQIERRNCPCIACLRHAGEWADRQGQYWMFYRRIRHFNLNEDEESDDAVVYKEGEGWDSCECEGQPISYWESVNSGEIDPEAQGEPEPMSESEPEPVSESEPEPEPKSE